MKRFWIGIAAVLACDAGGVVVPGGEGEFRLALELVAGDLVHPVALTAPADDDRLFVAQQDGRIRIIEQGQVLERPFLDLRSEVIFAGEQGLLGLAFHPDYATNGRFFVNYIDLDGDTRIEEYRVSADPDLADATSGRLVLAIDQPFANHNGGHLAFAPDGMLWIATGDGGGAGDPDDNAQDTGSLLGKLLRIDVDGGLPYTIPADNPYRMQTGARGEIWAIGLRNPWRFSFDAATGGVYVADVGQNAREEVNAAAAEDDGLNYGWPVLEGSSCYLATTCDATGLLLPALEYDHTEGCSVTGGYVYRGIALPEIRGHYFYSDYCSGFLRSARIEGADVSDEREWDVAPIGNVLSFGEDADGELYVLMLRNGEGRVYRIVEAE